MPTHSRPYLIDLSVESILNQTHENFILAICGDGVSDETREVVKKIIKNDDRVKFFDFEKTGRTGEINRNFVIEKYKPKYTTYLADDDLLLKNHIEVMLNEMEGYDFIHPLPMFVRFNNELFLYKESITEQISVKKLNRIPSYSFLTISGPMHNYEIYKRVRGWEDTPRGWPTDKFMWLKMINVNNIKMKNLTFSTTIKLQAPTDRDIFNSITKEDHRKWMLHWSEKIKNDDFFDEWNMLIKEKHSDSDRNAIGY
jgi:glycosyltransferase involved in cell wall biosynthesis